MPIDLITYFLKSNDAATQQLAEAAIAAMDATEKQKTTETEKTS